MDSNKILLVEDDPGVRFGIRDFLDSQGFEVDEAESCGGGEEQFRSSRPDTVIIDYLLPDGTALDLLPRLKAIDQAVPLIVLTAHGSIDLAVRTIKQGAEQFLTKPVDLGTLHIILQRILENQRNRQKQLAGRHRQNRNEVFPFLGRSSAIRQLENQAKKVLCTNSPVLVQGETGTGKGVLAKWLYDHGPRAQEAFVDLNCGALSPELLETELFGHEKGAFTSATSRKTGLLEVAHRGTVFLDEIGDVALSVQPKLLKVLEEKRFRKLGDVRDQRVDIHLIAATHQDLLSLVRENKFRSDLYFRISAIPLSVPPLRKRAEDIPVLAQHLLDRLAVDLGRGQLSLSPEATETLQAYPWPGNIRELRNFLERATLLSEKKVLDPDDLRVDAHLATDSSTSDSNLTLVELERQHVGTVLQQEHGNVARAAVRLGVPKSTLYQKIKKHGIHLSTSRVFD